MVFIHLDHRDRSGNLLPNKCEEDLSTRNDYALVWMIKHLAIMRFDTVRFLYPLIIQFGERIGVSSIERNDLDRFEHHSILEPGFHHRFLQDNGLVAFRAGRNEADLDAHLVRKEPHIFLCKLRQSIEFGDADRIRLPTRKRLVKRLNKPQIVRHCWEGIYTPPIYLIADTYFDLFEGIEDV